MSSFIIGEKPRPRDLHGPLSDGVACRVGSRRLEGWVDGHVQTLLQGLPHTKQYSDLQKQVSGTTEASHAMVIKQLGLLGCPNWRSARPEKTSAADGHLLLTKTM